MPSVGWPAKGSSSCTVKMRTRTPRSRSVAGLARQDESGFGKIHLARQSLHLLVAQPARIRETQPESFPRTGAKKKHRVARKESGEGFRCMAIYCSVELLTSVAQIMERTRLIAAATMLVDYCNHVDSRLRLSVERRSTGFRRRKMLRRASHPPDSRGRSPPPFVAWPGLTHIPAAAYPDMRYANALHAESSCVVVPGRRGVGSAASFPTPTRPKSGGFLFCLLILTR